MKTIAKQIADLQLAKNNIHNAISYTSDYLKFGGGSCDRSVSDLSMHYVKLAETLFLAGHKKEILADAEKLIDKVPSFKSKISHMCLWMNV